MCSSRVQLVTTLYWTPQLLLLLEVRYVEILFCSAACKVGFVLGVCFNYFDIESPAVRYTSTHPIPAKPALRAVYSCKASSPVSCLNGTEMGVAQFERGVGARKIQQQVGGAVITLF